MQSRLRGTHKILIGCSLGTFPLLFGASWLAGTILSAPVNHAVGDMPNRLNGGRVEFQSSSGSKIHGWLIPGRKGAGVIVLMHGYRADRTQIFNRASFLSDAGYGLLFFDFQAHGESQGKRITFGYLESRDAQAAIQYLKRNCPGEKIGLIGLSMGGAAALLATPPLEVDAMILELVYPDIRRAIENRITNRLGDWARILTPLLSWQLKPRLGINETMLRPIDHAGTINVPKLFIAGANDRHTTLAESRELFDRAGEPKQFWIVENAGHTDVHQLAAEEYERRVLDFFSHHLHH